MSGMGATEGPEESWKALLTLESRVFCWTFWMKGNWGRVKGVVMPDWSMKTMPKPERATVFGSEEIGEADAGSDVGVPVESRGRTWSCRLTPA